MSVLLEPILSAARETAIQEARREAETTAITAIQQELSSQQEGSGECKIQSTTMYIHVHVHVTKRGGVQVY